MIKKLLAFMMTVVIVVLTLGMFDSTSMAYDKTVYNQKNFEPVFNATYYATRYPDVAASCGNNADLLFEHFLFTGMNEGRQASPYFNVLVYMRENEDLRQAFGNELMSYYLHYIARGMKEGRTAYSKDEPLTYYDYFNNSFDSYFKDTVFVGDSIMLGYRNYCARQKGTYMPSIKFLCAGSYSLNNALKPVTDSNLHASYKGEKVSVWDGIKKMNAKHVYIMFGTNDLAITGVDGTIANYVKLINNIKNTTPDVDINIISMTYTVADRQGRGLNNNNIRSFNEKLKTLCDEQGCKYINLVDGVDDGTGNLNAGYCSDGFVHLNFTCYMNVWKPTFENAAFDSIYDELFTSK